MKLTSGDPKVRVGLVDGPVFAQHSDLEAEHITEISGHTGAVCRQVNSEACFHGTFIAGMLSAKRNSPAPAICPSCTLLIRPIFSEVAAGGERMPTATPLQLATAIVECVNAGAVVINLSLALAQLSPNGERVLQDALSHALRCGVLIVAAAGNQGTLGSSAIIRHPWVIPVVACDLRGRPITASNLGGSIGKRGLSAPGDNITSLGADGKTLTLGGTSVAVPFVTGTIALLRSEFPTATAAQIKLAVTQAVTVRRASVVPPLLNAEAAYQFLMTANGKRRIA